MEQEFKIPKDIKNRFLAFASTNFLFFIGFVILGVYAWQDPTSTSFRKYFFIPWFTFTSLYGAITNMYKANFMKIIVTEEQIRFESLGIIITSAWSKLITVEDCGTIFKKLDGISVLRPSIKKNIFGALETRSNHIPIHNFGDNWRDSDLGQQIKQHAPHLFEKEKSAQSA
jgi:hypothetical protein